MIPETGKETGHERNRRELDHFGYLQRLRCNLIVYLRRPSYEDRCDPLPRP